MAPKKISKSEAAGGSMSDASKRRGDTIEPQDAKGAGKGGPQQVISYNSDFDIQRLQYMVVRKQRPGFIPRPSLRGGDNWYPAKSEAGCPKVGSP